MLPHHDVAMRANCDSSKNAHATQHFHSDQHPIIRSFQPGEDWGWCYVDEVMMSVR